MSILDLRKSEKAPYFILLIWLDVKEEWHEAMTGTEIEVMLYILDLIKEGFVVDNLWVRRVEDYDVISKEGE